MRAVGEVFGIVCCASPLSRVYNIRKYPILFVRNECVTEVCVCVCVCHGASVYVPVWVAAGALLQNSRPGGISQYKFVDLYHFNHKCKTYFILY